MIKFLSIFKAENLINGLKNIFNRFPISAILSMFLFLYFAYYIESNYNSPIFLLEKEIIFSLIITFFLSVGIYIFGESLDFSRSKNQLFQIIPLALGGGLFCIFHSEFWSARNDIIFCMAFICSISFIFFAPFVKKIFSKNLGENEQKIYYSYFSSIFQAMCAAILVGILVVTLSFIAIYAVQTLFDYNYQEIYMHVVAFSFTIIAAFFGLNEIPKKENFEGYYFNENHFSTFLVKYLAIPFIFTYFVILYAYCVKVLMNFSDWPKGMVSWLVMLFSLFGYFIYIISYVYEEKITIVKIFRKYFPFVVFPQLFILFYAIFLRINQYGLTINRYLVVIFGIWLSVLTIYFVFSRKKYLAFISVSLFLFTLIFSVGPWSVYNLPEEIQTKALLQELKKEGIIDENLNIHKYEKKGDTKDEKIEKLQEIQDKIGYLCGNHNCELLRKYLKIENNDLEETLIRRWELAEKVKKELGLNVYWDYDKEEKDKVRFLYSSGLVRNVEISIAGYENLSYLNGELEYTVENDFKTDMENLKIKYYKNKNLLDEIDISNIIQDIIKNKKEKEIEKPVTYEKETEKYKYKIIIEDFAIPIKDGEYAKDWVNNGYNRAYISGFILYSKK
ncbi:DUF4153 domain-containing protein [Candidatus Gracilibacteria bacterium]|nr:MAG: DUF4153 domain-containing protein [Candidatus Gracilibacteria bacterium]